ncbi:hypothetical protein ACFL5O_09480 [Myxococcota bacterium]
MKQQPALQPAAVRWPLFLACATVFISSACIMILELVAGRLIAKYLSATLHVWTSVIGVVWEGPPSAAARDDACRTCIRPTRPALLFGEASLTCIAIIVLNNLVGSWTWLWQFPWL